MKLLLSSDAAPAASTADLTYACRRRSLAGLELTVGAGHAHGIDTALCPPREQSGGACVASAPRAPVHWLRVPSGTSKAMTLAWAGGAQRLGAGLLLPAPTANPPQGVTLALVHGTDPAGAQRAACWAECHSARTCWEVAPDASKAHLDATLEATGDFLGHVRFLGAGPEAQSSGAAEANPLWSALALRGYTGTVALAPSSEGDLDAWRCWLFETRGWGCNTAAEKAARHSSPSR